MAFQDLSYLDSCCLPTEASQYGVSGKKNIDTDAIRGRTERNRAECFQSSKTAPNMLASIAPNIVPEGWKVPSIFLSFVWTVSDMYGPCRK